MRVNWSGSSAEITYSVPAAQRDVTGFEVFSLRAAQTNAAVNPASGGQDFQVELIGGGHTKATYVGRFGPIPRPYDRPGAGTNQNAMTTVRIPLQAFIMNKSGVTLNNIDTVRLRFSAPSQGEIYVDDIEFSR
jgi:hypothetical protein